MSSVYFSNGFGMIHCFFPVNEPFIRWLIVLFYYYAICAVCAVAPLDSVELCK